MNPAPTWGLSWLNRLPRALWLPAAVAVIAAASVEAAVFRATGLALPRSLWRAS